MNDPRPPVAITGMSVLFPGAAGLEPFWRNLRQGVDAITNVPADRWDPSFYDPRSLNGTPPPDLTYCARGGFVDDDAVVDLADFGVMPTSVPCIDPDQLIALRVSASALADAGGRDRAAGIAPERIGVVFGRGGYLLPATARLSQRIHTTQQFVRTLGELLPDLPAADLERVRARFAERMGPFTPEAAIGTVPNLVASRVANRLDLRGPAFTVDAACASSLLAVDHAVAELASGRCDLMLAGGVHHCHDVTLWSVFSQLRALSPTQTIRPFDRRADGMLIGEGTGVVVLKRLEDAERDGDRIYAVIRGTAVAGDGRSSSLMAPLPAGQTRAIRGAWQAAGLDPRAEGAIGLLEAHGTGTPAGDQAELSTLADVFGPPRDRTAVLGSVKSMIGHTMPAAGIAGLIKAALALHHRVLLPTLHCEDPHPDVLATRFRPIDTARAWEEPGPRRAGVNAFGFGGINAHVVLEEAGFSAAVQPPPPRPTRAAVNEPVRVLRLEAAGPQEMAALLDAEDAALLRRPPQPEPAGALPRTRLGIVDPSARRLAAARTVVGRSIAGTVGAAGSPAWRGVQDVWFSSAPLLTGGGGTAFVFPGLEADFVPLGEDIARHFGLPLPPMPTGDVGRHAVSVVTLGRMLDAAVRRIGIVPDHVAGHSIGEWAAMTSAGLQSAAAMDRSLAAWDPDALRVPEVEYAVLGCGVQQARDALENIDDVVLSHDNAPNQVMVCGPAAPVGELVARMRADGVITQVLSFRSGFHTPMFADFLGPYRTMAEQLDLGRAAVPVWSATTAAPYPGEPAAIRDLFLRNLVQPVLFRPLIEAMHQAGVRVFVQLGVGQLTSLIDGVLTGRPHLAVPVLTRKRSGLDQLLRVATALWVEGAQPDLAALASPSTPVAPAPSKSGSRLPVRLRLGSPLVSLGADAPALIGACHPRTATGAAPRTPVSPDHPAARPVPDIVRPTSTHSASARPTSTHSASIHPTAPDRPPGPDFPRTVRFDVVSMPWLLDHAFVRQRPGWPEPADCRPIVPATQLIEHTRQWAQEVQPGRTAVTVRQIRLRRWVPAEPALEVRAEAVRSGPDEVTVTLGDHYDAVVDLADRYPDPPPTWPPDPTERPSPVQPRSVYEDRVMFHGPAFQGLTELTGLGTASVRGVVTVSETPGALLDNVGQLIGVWIDQQPGQGAMALPVRLDRVCFFGPRPAAGQRVEAVVRIRSFTPELIVADAQVSYGGRILATFEGWHDRRFLGDPAVRSAFRFPERRTQSVRQPGGWVVTADRWSDLTTRELIAGVHLNSAERADFEACSPRRRRGWLLGRIAVKDAVRQLLWAQDGGPVFPAEIWVSSQPDGRPAVAGRHGRVLPPLAVSLAHSGELAVAIARTARGVRGPAPAGGPGIDLEQILERSPATIESALGPLERTLLAESVARTGEPAERWFARFWTAKEAVAKAEGTGLRGRPQQFRVVSAGTGQLEVVAAAGEGNRYRVRCVQLDNPPGLPERPYMVAWTTGPTVTEPAPAAAQEKELEQ